MMQAQQVVRDKKSLHISMEYEVHADFRIQCFKKGLSMQEVLSEFARRVGQESNDVIRIMDQLVKDKQIKAVKKYTKTDIDDIYAMLEENDPLKGTKQ
jgi:hypothetical protein